MTETAEMTSRWRLILGQFAEELPLDGAFSETDDALAYLYNREYGSGRGVLDGDGGGDGAEEGEGGKKGDSRRGGSGRSVFTVPDWLYSVRKLFPKSAAEIMQKDALDLYGMDELLLSPEILSSLEPDITLLGKLLSFRSIIPENVKSQADEMIKRAAEEISKRLETALKRCFYGKKLSTAQTYYKVFRNFDFRRTVERNLKNYSAEYGTVIPKRLYFRNTVKRYNPWDIIILVDQSGSMCNSVIYSSVLASIFAKMPFLRTRLAVFDTGVADLSEYTYSAAELLMKVQLGGGTDIYKALCYGENLITQPVKTIVILITDLYEGGDIRRVYRKCADIIEGGSKMIVLPALDYSSAPVYNRQAANYLASIGADVAAITPEELADWIGNIIS